MTASAIAVQLLTSTATSKKGINIIIYIILGILLIISFLLQIIFPPEGEEAELYTKAVDEIAQAGIQGNTSIDAIHTIYILHYGDTPTDSQQISNFISSFFISDANVLFKQFMKKTEILERIRQDPFNFDEMQYGLVYWTLYKKFPNTGANGDINDTGNNGTNDIIPPTLTCAMKKPCAGNVTSPWGYRESPITPGEQELHTGMDICGGWHQPIYAACNGEVVSVNTQKSGYGNYVQIKHNSDNITFYSFYAHMSKINVSVGDIVTLGQQIGLEGGDPQNDNNPGDTTGHHLHFELRLYQNRNSTFDPHPYLTD